MNGWHPAPIRARDIPGRQGDLPLVPVWETGQHADFRRLALAAIVLPVLFIAGMAVAGRRLVEAIWPGHAPVLIDILTGTAAVIFGVTMVMVVRRARRQLLDQTRYVAIVEERERIARELHDSLAQALGAGHLRLRALAMHPQVAGQPPVRAEVDALAELCQDAYRDVREAIVGLRATPRADRGLLESLHQYVGSYARQTALAATVETDLTADPALSPHSEVQVIRVVQEALTNIRKHAEASRAVVRVAERGDEVAVEIEDDGCGFDPDAAAGADGPLADSHDPALALDPTGYGLRSMHERAALAGGRLSVESRPGSGTRVRMVVPRCRAVAVPEAASA